MNESFSFWIDADSCPVQIRTIVCKAAIRLNTQLYLVANRNIPIQKNKLFKMIISEQTPDAADNYIVEHSTQQDIVITRDIPLAFRLISNNVTVLNDRGIQYTQENIKERLSIRDFNLSLFSNGLISDKLSNFGQKEIKRFADCFDRIVQKKIIQNKIN